MASKSCQIAYLAANTFIGCPKIKPRIKKYEIQKRAAKKRLVTKCALSWLSLDTVLSLLI